MYLFQVRIYLSDGSELVRIPSDYGHVVQVDPPGTAFRINHDGSLIITHDTDCEAFPAGSWRNVVRELVWEE